MRISLRAAGKLTRRRTGVKDRARGAIRLPGRDGRAYNNRDKNGPRRGFRRSAAAGDHRPEGTPMATQPPYPPARTNAAGCMFPVLLLVFLAAVAAWWYWWWPNRRAQLNPEQPFKPVEARGSLSEAETMTIDVFKRNRNSVVHITTLSAQRNPFSLSLGTLQPEGMGSGIVWDKDGHIVTNYHVVRNADAARVTFGDNTTYRTLRIASAPDNDLAVLWIDAPSRKLEPIHVGNSKDLQVGQYAFAIGNPFGLDHTLTRGIISALGREIESVNGRTIQGVIQTDAPINPGNSGGPLLDSSGLLIGVNTAIASPSHAFAGIGFAIPVDDVNQVATELIRHGKKAKPGLGVHVASDQAARQLGVRKGVLIVQVLPDSPAAKAGLRGTKVDTDGDITQLGDVITAVDGKEISSVNALFSTLADHQVGDMVTLTIRRDGQEKEVSVALGAV
jgi:S1-C subfamily serine protease